MEKILEEFACGNIPPEPRFLKKDSRYGRAMETLLDCEDKLLAALNENEREKFNNYCNAQLNLVKYEAKMSALLDFNAVFLV